MNDALDVPLSDSDLVEEIALTAELMAAAIAAAAPRLSQERVDAILLGAERARVGTMTP